MFQTKQRVAEMRTAGELLKDAFFEITAVKAFLVNDISQSSLKQLSREYTVSKSVSGVLKAYVARLFLPQSAQSLYPAVISSEPPSRSTFILIYVSLLREMERERMFKGLA